MSNTNKEAISGLNHELESVKTALSNNIKPIDKHISYDSERDNELSNTVENINNKRMAENNLDHNSALYDTFSHKITTSKQEGTSLSNNETNKIPKIRTKAMHRKLGQRKKNTSESNPNPNPIDRDIKGIMGIHTQFITNKQHTSNQCLFNNTIAKLAEKTKILLAEHMLSFIKLYKKSSNKDVKKLREDEISRIIRRASHKQQNVNKIERRNFEIDAFRQSSDEVITDIKFRKESKQEDVYKKLDDVNFDEPKFSKVYIKSTKKHHKKQFEMESSYNFMQPAKKSKMLESFDATNGIIKKKQYTFGIQKINIFNKKSENTKNVYSNNTSFSDEPLHQQNNELNKVLTKEDFITPRCSFIEKKEPVAPKKSRFNHDKSKNATKLVERLEDCPKELFTTEFNAFGDGSEKSIGHIENDILKLLNKNDINLESIGESHINLSDLELVERKKSETVDPGITKDKNNTSKELPHFKRYSLLNTGDMKKININLDLGKPKALNFNKRVSKLENKYEYIEDNKLQNPKRHVSDIIKSYEEINNNEHVNQLQEIIKDTNPKQLNKLKEMAEKLTFQNSTNIQPNVINEHLFDTVVSSQKDGGAVNVQVSSSIIPDLKFDTDSYSNSSKIKGSDTNFRRFVNEKNNKGDEKPPNLVENSDGNNSIQPQFLNYNSNYNLENKEEMLISHKKNDKIGSDQFVNNQDQFFPPNNETQVESLERNTASFGNISVKFPNHNKSVLEDIDCIMIVDNNIPKSPEALSDKYTSEVNCSMKTKSDKSNIKECPSKRQSVIDSIKQGFKRNYQSIRQESIDAIKSPLKERNTIGVVYDNNLSNPLADTINNFNGDKSQTYKESYSENRNTEYKSDVANTCSPNKENKDNIYNTLFEPKVIDHINNPLDDENNSEKSNGFFKPKELDSDDDILSPKQDKNLNDMVNIDFEPINKKDSKILRAKELSNEIERIKNNKIRRESTEAVLSGSSEKLPELIKKASKRFSLIDNQNSAESKLTKEILTEEDHILCIEYDEINKQLYTTNSCIELEKNNYAQLNWIAENNTNLICHRARIKISLLDEIYISNLKNRKKNKTIRQDYIEIDKPVEKLIEPIDKCCKNENVSPDDIFCVKTCEKLSDLSKLTNDKLYNAIEGNKTVKRNTDVKPSIHQNIPHDQSIEPLKHLIKEYNEFDFSSESKTSESDVFTLNSDDKKKINTDQKQDKEIIEEKTININDKDANLLDKIIGYKLRIADKMNKILAQRIHGEHRNSYLLLTKEMENMVSLAFLEFTSQFTQSQIEQIIKIQRFWRKIINLRIIKKIKRATEYFETESKLRNSRFTLIKKINSQIVQPESIVEKNYNKKITFKTKFK